MAVIDGYPIDVTVSENHSFPGEATRFPVEVGADTTDHIRELPDEITLECIVSDTPIGEIATHPTRQSLGGEAPLPSVDALQRLLAMKRARRPVTVETSRGTFENMACIDLQVPDDKDKAGGLFFTITFQRVEIVTNRRTKIRVATPMAGAGLKGGKAKATKKSIDEFKVIGRETWRLGRPPGAFLTYPKFPWAIVIATETTSARETTAQQARVDISGRLHNENIIYRFGNAASLDFPDFVPGERLSNIQRDAFFRDRARDREFARREKQYELQQGYRRTPPTTLEPVRQVQTTGPANRNLPAGIEDLSRFNTPPPGPTFTPDGPNTTFPTGTHVIGGR